MPPQRNDRRACDRRWPGGADGGRGAFDGRTHRDAGRSKAIARAQVLDGGKVRPKPDKDAGAWPVPRIIRQRSVSDDARLPQGFRPRRGARLDGRSGAGDLRRINRAAFPARDESVAAFAGVARSLGRLGAGTSHAVALGGASWARLGSDGQWAARFAGHGIGVTPFAQSNVGLRVNWTEHMTPHFGQPIKSVAWRAGDLVSRGEAVLSANGLEGGGIYTLAAALRTEGATLTVDLLPDLSIEEVTAKLPDTARKGMAKILRNTLRLPPIKIALWNEVTKGKPVAFGELAQWLKALPLPHAGLRPLDEAISTAGGLSFDALDDTLMLRDRSGTFCAGEMLDWDAPTGGYLLTACFATGLWAGRHAADYDRP